MPRIFTTLLLLYVCQTALPWQQTITICKDCNQSRTYTETQLLTFLDSVGSLNIDDLKNEGFFYTDSVFNSRIVVDEEVSVEDFNLLVEAIESEELIDLSTYKSIFPFAPDRLAITDQKKVILQYFPFSESQEESGEFAIAIGSDINWENDVYFFRGNHLIEMHHIFHRGQLKFEHFSGPEGKLIISYTQNFGSGTGTWQYNDFYYQYEGQWLRPVLNLPTSTNLSMRDMSFRNYNLTLRTINKSPLTMDMTLYTDFPDTTLDGEAIFLNINTDIQFQWDKAQQTYTLSPGSTINYDQLLSFGHFVEHLHFIKAYYDRLKKDLEGENVELKRLIFRFLANVHNQYHPR